MIQKGIKSQPVPDKRFPWYPEKGQPTWEVALLFPPQGRWTEDEFLALEKFHGGFPLLELSRGRLEVLPLPTQTHQLIMQFLYELLKAFVTAHAPGVVLVSGMKVGLGKGKVRQPDVMYMKAEHDSRCDEDVWDGADLVMEVVSPDPKDRKRDLEDKPREYARAGIPEYWIIDPGQRFIRVLTREGKAYRVHGEFRPGTRATSVLLPGFEVPVDAALAPPGSRPGK